MAAGGTLSHPASPGTNSCSNCGSVNLSTTDACTFCGHSLPRHQSSIVPGDQIAGKYQVLSLLGVGGMGEVFKVRHLSLDDIRCIKLMRTEVMDDEQFRARFIREARVATRIHHPNVAVIHDFDTTELNQHFLVSEFIDGITVRQWSRRHGRYPPELAIHLVLQVLSGLRHIHTRGLLHRDISGDNIMITLDHDEQPLAKIIDLGIAKNVGGTTDVTHATQVGSFIGNPKYSSPEQLGMLDDEEMLDARSDLYSLGIVFYEMLTGSPPFESRTPQGYLAKHLTQKPPPFASVAPDAAFPDGLEQIALRALEKNRDDRYESARSFSVGLRAFISDDLDLAQYSEMIIGDLPSCQASRLLHDVTPLPATPRSSSRAAETPTVVARTDVDPASIDDEAWRNARDENTRFSFEQYLLLFSSGRHANEARARVHDFVDLEMIEALRGEKDEAGLREIAADRGRSPSVRSAADAAIRQIRKSRDETAAAWRIASALGSVQDLERFIQEHPDFDGIGQAHDLLDQLRMAQEASESEDADVWARYLERWPKGRFADEARQAVARSDESKALDAAMSDPSTAVFRAWLRNFPDSARRDEALRYLEENLAWDQMGWVRRDLERFLELYPKGLHADQARQRLTKLKEFEEDT